ncbi:MAG: hypothetical protein KAI28_06805 [Sphingomonadales bacterium]|nr:hypothetical protein [Sphingomonadales bacterium]
MRTFEDIENSLDTFATDGAPLAKARAYLDLSEEVLENWIIGRDMVPTEKEKEGFRILALHRQGAKGEPSFNACRETCRELAYHYNLVAVEPDHEETEKRLYMMSLLANHMLHFVGGKMKQSQLGEFCCSSRSLRANMTE